MRREQLPSFDDTIAGQNFQALMFPADSFKELQALSENSTVEVSLRKPIPGLPILTRRTPAEAQAVPVEALAPDATETLADAESAPDQFAVRRTAMVERRRRRGSRRRREMRSRGGPRVCMF